MLHGNNKYRYWTGLLLLVRVILYITASVTISGDPETSLLITLTLVGNLSLIREITGARVYKNSFLNIVGAMLLFNLLALSGFSWYRFKTDFTKQTAVAYTSTIITFILLVGAIIYHVYLLVRKDRPRREEEHEYLQLAPVQPAKAEVTYSIVEIPNLYVSLHSQKIVMSTRLRLGNCVVQKLLYINISYILITKTLCLRQFIEPNYINLITPLLVLRSTIHCLVILIIKINSDLRIL